MVGEVSALRLGIAFLRVVQFDGVTGSNSNWLGGSLAEIEAKAIEETLDYLAGLPTRMRDAGLGVSKHVRRGKAFLETAAHAKQVGISRLVLGSVAGAVVRESGVPVLVVRSASPAY